MADRQGANQLVRDGLRINPPFTNRWGLAHNIEMLSWIAAAEGHHEHAARLLGAADPLWQSTGVLPSTLRYTTVSHDQCEQQTRQSLGDAQFAIAFREGTRLTIDEAIAYALELREVPTPSFEVHIGASVGGPRGSGPGLEPGEHA
jgi:hypothetical protein